MPGGRPPKGVNHVDKLEGSRDAKRRLRVIMQVNAGELTVREACKRLEIGESRFHVIREQALQAAIDRLEQRSAGRPQSQPKEDSPEAARIKELEEQVQQLKIDVVGARTKTEIALAMPHLFKKHLREDQDDIGDEDEPKKKRMTESIMGKRRTRRKANVKAKTKPTRKPKEH